MFPEITERILGDWRTRWRRKRQLEKLMVDAWPVVQVAICLAAMLWFYFSIHDLAVLMKPRIAAWHAEREVIAATHAVMAVSLWLLFRK